MVSSESSYVDRPKVDGVSSFSVYCVQVIEFLRS